jgi:hypothetical protein
MGGPRGFACHSHGVQEQIIKAAAFDALWMVAELAGKSVPADDFVKVREALHMTAGIDADDDT